MRTDRLQVVYALVKMSLALNSAPFTFYKWKLELNIDQNSATERVYYGGFNCSFFFLRVLIQRSFPKLFDNDKSETKSEANPETDQTDNKTQTPAEQEPLVQSQENLAFEEDEKHLEPKDTSADSASSTLETTVEPMESEKAPDTKELEKVADDSGISVDHVNGNDVISTKEETKEDEHDQGHKVKPVLESISAFAMQFMEASAPEIKVDKPQTLFSVATEDAEDAPPGKPPQSPRRHTEHNIKNRLLDKNSLLPEAALTKRRHSDFAVSAPRPVNDELATQDLKKRGSVGAGIT